MRKIALFSASALLLCLSLAYANPEITADDIKADIKRLASDEFEGRFSVSPGAMKASKFIADNYKKYGLKPMGNKGTFFFDFPMMGTIQTGAGNELRIEFPKRHSFELKKDFVPVTISPNKKTVSGEVVFVGYGISSPEAGWDDYSGLDVKGKVVVVIRGTPKDKLDKLEQESTINRKAEVAQEKGAVGIIFVGRPTENASELVQLAGQLNTSKEGIVAVSATEAAANEFLKPAGKTYIDARSAIDNGSAPNSFALTTKVELTTELSKGMQQARNVAGFLEGRDPILKKEIIVIGGHYDHLGYGQVGAMDPGNTQIHYGADDNASGTAAVMELAEKIASEHNNKRSYLFLAFAGEEEGLFGSRAFVKNPTIDLKQVDAMLNLDMVGRLKDDVIQIGGVGTSPVFESLLRNLNSDHFQLKLEKTGYAPSDNTSFYQKNIPVLFFFTGDHADYHRHTDTWDKINYPGEEKVVKYIYRIAKQLDSMDNRIAFTESGGSFPIYSQIAAPAMSTRKIKVGFQLDYNSTNGLVLKGVSAGSPAETAGLKAGDIVTAWDDTPLTDLDSLQKIMTDAKPGKQVKLTIKRGSETLYINVIPEAVK